MTVDEANDRVVKPASFDYFYEETLQLVVDTDLDQINLVQCHVGILQ